MELQCEGYKTCLEDCPMKTIIDYNDIIPGSDLYFKLMDHGSCWHNNHSDGKYHEYGIVTVN